MSVLNWITTTKSECRNESDVCISDSAAKELYNQLKPSLSASSNKKAVVIEGIKKKFGCNSEYCAIKKLLDFPDLDDETKELLSTELEEKFKQIGPRNTTALTSNSHLDGTLQLWAQKNKSFYPFGFCMIDFQETEKCSLARADFNEIFKKYTHCACILNTDVDTGKGKHWVCIFIDDRVNPRTIEYFNSSGNPPAKHISKWMTDTAKKMNKPTKVVIVANRRLQNSKTECGLYCLFFIRARCERVPYEKFRTNNIPDSEMIEFRKHVFAG